MGDMSNNHQLSAWMDKMWAKISDTNDLVRTQKDKLEEMTELVSELQTTVQRLQDHESKGTKRRLIDENDDEFADEDDSDDNDDDENDGEGEGNSSNKKRALSHRLQAQITYDARKWKTATLETLNDELADDNRFILLAQAHCPELEKLRYTLDLVVVGRSTSINFLIYSRLLTERYERDHQPLSHKDAAPVYDFVQLITFNSAASKKRRKEEKEKQSTDNTTSSDDSSDDEEDDGNKNNKKNLKKRRKRFLNFVRELIGSWFNPSKPRETGLLLVHLLLVVAGGSFTSSFSRREMSDKLLRPCFDDCSAYSRRVCQSGHDRVQKKPKWERQERGILQQWAHRVAIGAGL
jgi:hypothetical protein